MQKILFVAAALSTSAFAVPPADNVAWEVVEGLTTEIGPRPAGSAAEARAREWGVAKLTSLGFKNVHIETFKMKAFVRGEESVEVVAPFPQRMVANALGYSGSTGPKGITGEVVAYPSLAAFEAADPADVKRKIVFVSHHMGRTQDGSAYGPFGDVRRKGPALASKRGALAIVLRSVGTDHQRGAHTGYTSWGDQEPIPAAALSIPDAGQLERILARGKPVTLKLVLISKTVPDATSGNVVAEIPGRDPAAGVVLVGGHLDSWDMGTGAIDDGAGVAIMTAAAKRVAAAGQPLRTIRVVWFGSEEINGGDDVAYKEWHGAEKHVLVGESDFGADRVWRFDTRVVDPSAPIVKEMAQRLEPLGIAWGNNDAHGGSDIEAMVLAGAPVIDLNQDGTRYFDIHHTPDDTLDKIDPVQLEQNVAAWAAVIDVAANSKDELKPGPPPKGE